MLKSKPSAGAPDGLRPRVERKAVHTPGLRVSEMLRERVACSSSVLCAEVASLWMVGEEGLLRGNSGERGDLMRFPREMGPFGGWSRVGERK